MTNNKLYQEKEKLSQAFTDLEVAVLNKINQIKQEVTTNSNLPAKDQAEINNWNEQINQMQIEMANIGEENELLKYENKNLKLQTTEICQEIQFDLEQIKKIINQN